MRIPIVPAVARTALLVFLASFFFRPPCHLLAGEGTTGEMLSDDVAYLFEDFRDVFSSPAHFDGSDWLRVGAAAGAAIASALWADEPVQRFSRANRSPFLDDLSSVGDYYGRLSTGYYLGSALYLAGALADDDWTRLTGRAVIEAHTFSLLVTGVLKAAAGRSRPYLDQGNAAFGWFETKTSRWSLPSGHATAAFAISSVLSKRIDSPWATAGLFALSGVTVLDRIYDDKHWLSDTILGAAIGTAIGMAVGDMIDSEEEERRKGGLEALDERPVDLLRFSLSF
ncbi:PA-phosphatase [Prosthecochloris sp. GSB1]|uniref:phosphatase PAP2 family protein n=1 Tax=Prosthecochloris sp. GSB1 TaxID=281093 RepID=UPI000B8CDBAD|nr:phosphatase PAP2 family protein [Prosthecochloris sp. GSB1]ASQ90630.1 PA-phosphatase [Prosthecochloris sp. GSB1]